MTDFGEKSADAMHAATKRDNSDDLTALFTRNRAWAQSKTLADPSFFSRLVDQQRTTV